MDFVSTTFAVYFLCTSLSVALLCGCQSSNRIVSQGDSVFALPIYVYTLPETGLIYVISDFYCY